MTQVSVDSIQSHKQQQYYGWWLHLHSEQDKGSIYRPHFARTDKSKLKTRLDQLLLMMTLIFYLPYRL